jgi:hypothetical protein
MDVQSFPSNLSSETRLGSSPGRKRGPNRMNRATLHEARNSHAGTREHLGEGTVAQRPGTAKGIMFMTLHDETGYGNVVIKPAVCQQYQTLIKKSRFRRVQGKLQKVETAKEGGAFVVTINASGSFRSLFPRSRTDRGARTRQSAKLNVLCVDVTGSPRKSVTCAIISAWMSKSNGCPAGTLRPRK